MTIFKEILGYKENDFYIYDNIEQVLEDIDDAIDLTNNYFNNYNEKLNFINNVFKDDKLLYDINKFEFDKEFRIFNEAKKKILAYNYFIDCFGDIFKNQKSKDNFKILVFMGFVIDRIELKEYIKRIQSYPITKILRLFIFLHNYKLFNLTHIRRDNENRKKPLSLDKQVLDKSFRVNEFDVIIHFNFDSYKKNLDLKQIKNAKDNIYRDDKYLYNNIKDFKILIKISYYLIQYYYSTYKNSADKFDVKLIQLIEYFEKIELGNLLSKDISIFQSE